MDTKTKLIAAAEALFDRHGFTATGMDRLTHAAGMSSRTLYKHAGSKTALMAAVLAERDRRFLRQMDVDSVDALFAALEDWVRVEGCRGCLFLRAHGETGGEADEITEAVLTHKTRLLERIRQIVTTQTGSANHRVLAEQILILFEGATAASIYQGTQAISAARQAAATLVEQAQA